MKFTDSPKYKDNVILKLTFEFAIDIVRYSENSVLQIDPRGSVAGSIKFATDRQCNYSFDCDPISDDFVPCSVDL